MNPSVPHNILFDTDRYTSLKSLKAVELIDNDFKHIKSDTWWHKVLIKFKQDLYSWSTRAFTTNKLDS